MSITKQIAKHFREAYFGVNWTWVNLKETLAGVTWQQATTQVYDCNTILALVYHIHFYPRAVMNVLQGGTLDAHDKYAFSHPPIQSQEEWEQFLDNVWKEGEQFAGLVEQLPDSILEEIFTAEKYGNYYRNLDGIIEHTHYHLGQIVIIKKVLSAEKG